MLRVVEGQHVGGGVLLSVVTVQRAAFFQIDDAHGDLGVRGQRVADPSRDLVAGQGGAVGGGVGQIAELERIASHVGLMVDGKLVMCQTLDELKSNVVRLVVQGHQESQPLPGLGTVLQSDRFGDIWRGIVHQPDVTLLEQVAADRETVSLQFERLSLEEIYSSVIAFNGVKAAEIVNGGTL